jgi:hypothetical protein
MIYIVSYPKCGRTWFRKLIEVYEKKTGTKSKEKTFTHIGFGYEGSKRLRDEVMSRSKKDAVINISRDPLDALVSYYHDALARGKQGYKAKAKKGIDKFCIEQTDDYLKFKTFEKEIEFDCRLSYERMINNTFKEILPAFKILFDKLDQSKLKEAVEYCEFENLSKLERSGKEEMHSTKTFRKTRKGKIGSHKEELKEKTIKTIKEKL